MEKGQVVLETVAAFVVVVFMAAGVYMVVLSLDFEDHACTTPILRVVMAAAVMFILTSISMCASSILYHNFHKSKVALQVENQNLAEEAERLKGGSHDQTKKMSVVEKLQLRGSGCFFLFLLTMAQSYYLKWVLKSGWKKCKKNRERRKTDCRGIGLRNFTITEIRWPVGCAVGVLL